MEFIRQPKKNGPNGLKILVSTVHRAQMIDELIHDPGIDFHAQRPTP